MTEKPARRHKMIKRLIIAGGIAVLLVILVLLAGIAGIDYLVDLWWFDALGYGFYYWQRLLYRYAVLIAVSGFFFLIFWLNFWLAARFMKKPVSEEAGDTKHDTGSRRGLLKKFKTGSLWFYAAVSLGLSIPIALPLFAQWERFLFFLYSSPMGVADPYLGKDISFYLFSLPIYTLIQRRLLLALVVLAAALLIFYLFKNRLLGRSLFKFGRGARIHLSLLVLLLFGIEIWDFMLQRYALVYDTSHQGLFYGPGYVQMKVVLPLIWACMATLAGTALALIMMVQWRKGYKAGAVLVLLFAAALGLRYTDLLPHLVQTYVVKPNEIAKEAPYIARHIQATLDGYGLTDLQVRQFQHESVLQKKTSSDIADVLRNVPVWDPETLAEVFQQLQELRTYYLFPTVSVGRYQIEGRRQQVFLAPREIEFNNLPGGARNWINEHMTYTHGFGVVMTPASQVSGQGLTWYLHSIPPQSDVGLTIAQPRIYYGLGSYNYSIAPNEAGEMDYPKGDRNVMTDYAGRGGVAVSSLYRKFLLSYYLKNKNVFFSTKITESSRLLFRRNIIERIHHLAPYLKLDDAPYVAVTPRGIYWIVDAYTTSADYPAAVPGNFKDTSVTYVRNAVKIVVDAYHGSVDMYVFDQKDPIVKAYQRIYPGLFKPKEALPEDLRQHIRYPKDLFHIQMQVYAKYHQKDPQVFYQQEDLWTFAESLRKDTTVPREPYYVTLDLIEPGKMDFLLLLPMFPKNRNNLRAVAIAGCDPEHYGEIILYDFPKGELVYGPAQIDALINQDPEIAEQFTLWDQAGSEVVRGKMIILPVGNSVLFIQPVYLKATSQVRIPELQRIIMSEGQEVVMDTSIQKAYDELLRRVGSPDGESSDRPVETPPPPQSVDKNDDHADQPPADQPPADQPPAHQPPAEQPSVDQPPAETPDAREPSEEGAPAPKGTPLLVKVIP